MLGPHRHGRALCVRCGMSAPFVDGVGSLPLRALAPLALMGTHSPCALACIFALGGLCYRLGQRACVRLGAGARTGGGDAALSSVKFGLTLPNMSPNMSHISPKPPQRMPYILPTEHKLERKRPTVGRTQLEFGRPTPRFIRTAPNLAEARPNWVEARTLGFDQNPPGFGRAHPKFDGHLAASSRNRPKVSPTDPQKTS